MTIDNFDLYNITKQKNIFTLIVLLFFIFSNTNAQQVFNLSTCIKTGLENNYSIKIIRNNQKINQNNYTIGNAGMLPVLATTSNLGGNINSTKQNLRNGTENSINNINNNFANANIGIDYTIFKGFEVQQTYKKLGKQLQIGELTTQLEIENLVSQIIVQYNYYIQQLIQYHNLEYAVQLSRERVRIDRQRYLLGGASKLELLQSIVYLNADSSRYARQNEVIKTAQVQLNQLLVLDSINNNFLIADTVITINPGLFYDSLLNQTMQKNPSLQIASQNKNISDIDYKIIKSKVYPYLKLNTSYGYNYNNYEIGEYTKQQTYGLNYGITLGLTIFDGFNRQREISNARINIENNEYRYKQIELAILSDLQTIYFAYQNNLALLKLEEQNLNVARENLEIALERYRLGNLAGLELREVQKSLLDAEERLVSVKFQTKLAEISLMQISGNILQYL